MPDIKPINFGNSQQSGVDALAGASPVAVNVVREKGGTVRRRPGLQTPTLVTSSLVDADGIVGMHVTVDGQVYAVGNNAGGRKVYRVTSGGSVELSPSGTSKLLGTGRPVFAETEALLVIAGGGPMQKVVLGTTAISRLGGDPPNASHVTANSLRLEANDLTVDRSKIRYSDISAGTLDFSGHETWTLGGIGTAGFFSAEARPDPILALGENTNELFVVGSTNVQVFAPDPALVYAPVATREYGCTAPYSFFKVDQTFAWLDHRRRFVVTDGRTFEVISDDIQQTLDDIADPSDCYGYRVRMGPIDCLVWTFPSDGRTFCFQMGAGWSEWLGANIGGGNWNALPVLSHAHDPTTNTNFVGTTDGYVGELKMGVDNDLGTEIVSYVETGFLNRGTDRRKHCIGVRLTFERGQATGVTSEPVGFLSWADAPGKWSNPKAIRLGSDGDTSPVVSFRSLGVYRRRAWKFTFSAAIDLVLAGVEEEFEILEQ